MTRKCFRCNTGMEKNTSPLVLGWSKHDQMEEKRNYDIYECVNGHLEFIRKGNL